MSTPTGQIEEIGFLAILVEDSGSAVFHFGGRQHSNCAFGKLVGESRSTVGILECGDSGRDYSQAVR